MSRNTYNTRWLFTIVQEFRHEWDSMLDHNLFVNVVVLLDNDWHSLALISILHSMNYFPNEEHSIPLLVCYTKDERKCFGEYLDEHTFWFHSPASRTFRSHSVLIWSNSFSRFRETRLCSSLDFSKMCICCFNSWFISSNFSV